MESSKLKDTRLIALLLISITVIASGCIDNGNKDVGEQEEQNIEDRTNTADTTEEVSGDICDASFPPELDYEITPDELEAVNGGYALGEYTVEGEIDVETGLPEDVTTEKALNETQVYVKGVKHSSSIVAPYSQAEEHLENRENKRFETLCEADTDGNQFSCTFDMQDPGEYVIGITSEYKGCENEEGSIERMDFVPVLEESRYENEDIVVEIRDIELESVEDGWKNFLITSYLENIDIGTDKASEGVTVSYRMITKDGEYTDRETIVSNVLEGYDDQRESGVRIREDQEPKYLYVFSDQMQENLLYDIQGLE